MAAIPSEFRSKHPYIPTELHTYFERLLKRPEDGSQFHRAMECHQEATFRSLNHLFQKVSQIVSMPPDEVLRRVDFNKNDLSPERIESLLAELRAIVFLHDRGFKNIIPIRAGARKSPDLSASAHGCDFLIEVVTSPHFAPRVFHDSVVKWAVGRLNHRDKLDQIEGASATCQRMFVIVLNSSGAVALNQRSDYLQMLREVWQALGSQPNLFIALVTGRVSLGEGTDDCIFPEMA